MDLLTRSDIQSLAASEAEGMHVSLFMPTHRFGSGIQADQLQWKNLVSGVESVLLQEMRRPDVEALLAPARELHGDSMAWQYLSDGLAMFLSPGHHQTFRIPASLPVLATAGDHFVTGPLMRLLSGDAHFLLLAISQGEVRLMDGSRHTVRQIELEDVPTSLADAVAPGEARSDSMARSLSGGRGGRAIFYGHSGDDDAKKEDLIKFFRQVASGLHEVLAGQTAPMVLVGLEQNMSAYRELNTYANVLDEAVLRNPDDLSGAELHQLAWLIVEERLRTERSALIERFREMNAAGRGADDLAAVADAAAQGRVDTLFMQSDPWCWERVAGASEAPVVRLGVDDDRFRVCEMVDKAAVDTLAAGGKVHATSQEVVADSEVAAILRY